jgi:hypothetical protein
MFSSEISWKLLISSSFVRHPTNSSLQSPPTSAEQYRKHEETLWLFLAFHSKKLPKRTKQPALALCFSKATREDTRARGSTSGGALCGFPQWCHLNPKRYNHLPLVLAYLPAFAIETISDQIIDT